MIVEKNFKEIKDTETHDEVVSLANQYAQYFHEILSSEIETSTLKDQKIMLYSLVFCLSILGDFYWEKDHLDGFLQIINDVIKFNWHKQF